jgi:RHS repeat-associated protein
VPTYNYNSSNELTSNSSGSYTYDNNGNALTDASGKSYTWDFENRLRQAVVPGTGTTTFKYDPFGRRIQKSGPLGLTNYLYDGNDLIQEMDNGGNILAKYTHGTVVDEDLAMLRNGTASYYHQDGLGSITSLSSSAGALADTYAYDAFGRLTASTGNLTNPFQYTGREFDSEIGTYFYRARYYDPIAGRFSAEDPLRFDAGPNFYEYVNNSPANLVDPFGLQSQTPLPPGCYPPFATPWSTGIRASLRSDAPASARCSWTAGRLGQPNCPGSQSGPGAGPGPGPAPSPIPPQPGPDYKPESPGRCKNQNGCNPCVPPLALLFTGLLAGTFHF